MQTTNFKTAEAGSQELYLVYGGAISDPRRDDFSEPGDIEIVGIYPSYEDALDAWRGVSQRHIDEAFVKYRLVRIN